MIRSIGNHIAWATLLGAIGWASAPLAHLAFRLVLR